MAILASWLKLNSSGKRPLSETGAVIPSLAVKGFPKESCRVSQQGSYRKCKVLLKSTIGHKHMKEI
jgi:hypothetical protein